MSNIIKKTTLACIKEYEDRNKCTKNIIPRSPCCGDSHAAHCSNRIICCNTEAEYHTAYFSDFGIVWSGALA